MMKQRIESPRWVLRRWRADDIEDLMVYAVDREWGRYLPVPDPYTREAGERFIEERIELAWEERLEWAIEHEGKVVGGLTVLIEQEGRRAMIGYSLARSLWGEGLMTAIAMRLRDEAFESLSDLMRFWATADVENEGSLRIMEKLGMRREGVTRCALYERGEWRDHVTFSLLRPEWERLEKSREMAPGGIV